MKFKQGTTSYESKWTKFRGRDQDDKRFALDLKIRPLFPHVAREIQRPFLMREGVGAAAVERVPEEASDAYGAAIADHLIDRLGGPDEPEHSNGVEADYTANDLLVGGADAAEYGVPTLTPGMDPGVTHEAPWPMTPEGKYVLLNMIPNLQQHITEFARQIANPLCAVTPERQDQDDANLQPSPSSEPSSPSATAGDEESRRTEEEPTE